MKFEQGLARNKRVDAYGARDLRARTEIDRNSEFIQNQIVHAHRGSNSGCDSEPETSEAVE
jgi:hypothetical protein